MINAAVAVPDSYFFQDSLTVQQSLFTHPPLPGYLWQWWWTFGQGQKTLARVYWGRVSTLNPKVLGLAHKWAENQQRSFLHLQNYCIYRIFTSWPTHCIDLRK